LIDIKFILLCTIFYNDTRYTAIPAGTKKE
jgi:hypothetical protein